MSTRGKQRVQPRVPRYENRCGLAEMTSCRRMMLWWCSVHINLISLSILESSDFFRPAAKRTVCFFSLALLMHLIAWHTCRRQHNNAAPWHRP